MITAALDRGAELDSRNVFVEAKGRTAVRNGVVRSMGGEVNEAATAAWAALGVTASTTSSGLFLSARNSATSTA